MHNIDETVLKLCYLLVSLNLDHENLGMQAPWVILKAHIALNILT